MNDEVLQLLRNQSPVAIGISGGKDSTCAAVATIKYLNSIGHTGPRVLIHSDLGRVEWKASMRVCEDLAKLLSLELIVVRRKAGDMLQRWESRWQNNVERYRNLECVKLILPWSTPKMRFCTSELKTAIICSELIKRFPGQKIISVSGIRKQESSNRAKAPIHAVQNRLTNVTHQTSGIDWHPILDWTLDNIWAYHVDNLLPVHEAYTQYGSSRVSCAFCIMSSEADLRSAASCHANADIYRSMVDLEIKSSFSFQGKWLGDVAPELLTPAQQSDLVRSKLRAVRRESWEGQIPESLLYVKGWPTRVPTYDEAVLLANVRKAIALDSGIFDMKYIDPVTIIIRFKELMAMKGGGK
ncbi:phosphoadenosine phosphosulfate reductase family protein [Siphonobacter sp. BAB-5385]|uniref:phosphoadenosine phosphosulfate reductase domain-containing protein n=1 Tax=Siphonobacter sp. BAB-5385 TaxID=1864822 RepID=UPI001595A134|nr:phosphoadenosine phosphosulfate reductase family protein [Siphonobacter sp. BAB-5385]